MKTRKITASGSPFEQVRHRFDFWRKTRKRCSPIPETLWSSAVELAREHGLHRTARTLRLNYYSLKKRFPLIPGSPSKTQRSEEHTSELQSQSNLVCRLLLEKKKK